MFVAAYIIVTLAIALRCRSLAAYAALPALIGTMALFWADVGHAGAYSSALWGLSGLYLLRNSEYVAGALYGISGLVYVGFYFGGSNATFAVIPVVSDLCFGAGLIAGTWPNLGANIRGFYRRDIRGSAVQIAREDLARSAFLDRVKG